MTRGQLKAMTDREIVDAMRANDPLSRARQAFASSAARIEQASLQRTPLSIIEIRRMEFDAALDVMAAYLGHEP